MAVQYKVKPITRFVVTRFESDGESAADVRERGIFDNGETAYHVAYAMCRVEHEASGEEPGSMNFLYPDVPAGVVVGPTFSW